MRNTTNVTCRTGTSYLPEYFIYFISLPVFRRVRVAQSKGFGVVVCLLLFVFCP